MIVTIGGPPGAGTSTVSRLLEERTGYRYVYAGQVFRDLAIERGMSLTEFGELCENDPSVDRELDGRMLDIALEMDDLILEGRMTGPLCKKNGISALKVYIDADTRIRASRVMERDGGEIDIVMGNMQKRERSEAKRYMNYYGIDPRLHDHYDLVMDSGNLSPEEEIEIILKRMDGMV